MPQISTGKLREWSIFKGDNRSDKTDNSGYCPIWRTKPLTFFLKIKSDDWKKKLRLTKKSDQRLCYSLGWVLFSQF